MSRNIGGINLCNAWGSVVYSAHLYNAVRNSVGLEAEWKDMEYLLSVHSRQRIFGGTPPAETDEYLKRLLLAMRQCPIRDCARKRHSLLEGWRAFLERYSMTDEPVSGVESDEKRRKDSKQEESKQEESKETQRKKRPHGLRATTPVKNIFYKRYVEHGALDLSTTNLAKLLSQAMKVQRPSNPSVDLQELAAKRLYNPLQLLDIVREGVAAEERHLLFDYFGFHQRS